MIKVKDGYGKLIGSEYKGSADQVLLSDGSNLGYAIPSTGNTLVLRNTSGQIESSLTTDSNLSPFVVTSTVVNTNLNSDLLDGFHAGGLFQTLSSSMSVNLTVKIGNTEKKIEKLYATYDGLGNTIAAKYVTLDTAQTVSGVKTFSSQQKFTVSSVSPFTVDSNIVVTNLNADLLDGTHKADLFTDFSNITSGTDANKVSITIGGTTKKIIINYAQNAGSIGGITADGLFTDLSSTPAKNLSITIGGTTKDITSLYSNYWVPQAIGSKDFNTMYGDTYRGTSWYGGGSNTATNNPLGSGQAFGMQVWRNADGHTAQLIMGSDGRLYVRVYNGSSWSQLQKFAYATDAGQGGGYWANLPVQAIADSTTTPTFGGVTVNGTSLLNGQVGIGILNPKAKLAVNISALSANPTSGSLGTLNTMSVGAAGSYGTYFWTKGTGKGYIQVGREDGTATVYDLILQVLGGNVGIGTESPADKLHVNGGQIRSAHSSRYLRIGPQNSSHAHYETNADISHWFNKRVEVNGHVNPYTNNSFTSGTSDKRWSNIYSVLGNFAGTVSINCAWPNIVCNNNASGANESNIRFEVAGANKGYVGYNTTYGTWVYNSTAQKYLGISDAGVPHVSNHPLLYNYRMAVNSAFNANNMTTNAVLYTPTGDVGSNTSTWSNFPTGKPAGGFGLLNINEGYYERQIFGTYANPHLYTRYKYYSNGSVWSGWSTIALTSDIPNPANYYWANIRVSASSSTGTYPTFANMKSTGRVYLDEWIQFSGSSGLLWPNANGAHLYANTTTSYAGLITQGARNGYCGLHCGPNTNYMTVMSTNTHHGLYCENTGQWEFYYNRANKQAGILTRILTSGHALTVGGNISVVYNSYPGLTIHNNTTSGESSIYVKNNTAGWALGVNPWGLGAGQFAIGQYSGTGSSSWRFRIDNNGYCYTNSYLNLGGGHEKNARSPTYVWGSNSSDTFLRSYQTSKLSVNYANSAGTSSNVVVNNSNANSTYRMVWHSGNTLYSTNNIYCNPSTDQIYSAGFRHVSYNSASYLLRSDGGAAGFHWSGQGGQPTWLWGGNSQHTYYVYNPSNFNVNSAAVLRGNASNPNNSHPGHGAKVFYSWNTGQANNASSGYSNGITIGSHPNSTAYGFQIVQNMWDDRTYTRRYNGGWQSWKTLAWTSDIPSVGNGTIIINQGGSEKGRFTVNQSGTTTINLTDSNTNTWRGVENVLTSTSTSNSLTANMGRVLANGASDRPIVLLAGTLYRSGASSSYTTWYFTGYRHRSISSSSPSVYISGGVARFYFTNASGYGFSFAQVCANHQASGEATGYQSGEYQTRSSGLFWFGTYATGQYLYIRAIAQGNNHNDTAESYSGMWTSYSDGVTRVSIIAVGYAQ